MKKLNLSITFAIGLLIWIMPHPEALKPAAWHLFAIFIATIYAVITKPIPMGAVTFTALTIATLSNTLTFAQAFSGFSNDTVWLIVLAFFVARGFIKTGLGMRISYLFIKMLGKSTLGLAYGISATDLILAPAIPSVTARSGGIIFPILDAISKSFDSQPHQDSSKKIGSFLTLVTMQATTITSSMFLTAMSANPLIAGLANEQMGNATITWTSWAIAALVPGLASLTLVPLVLYKLFPPELKKTPDAPASANKSLKAMGPIGKNEWIMLGVFGLLIALWAGADFFGIKAPIAALLGLTILLLTNVLNWEDIKNEKGAWETMVWFGILFMLASELNKMGMTSWFQSLVSSHVTGFGWKTGFTILSLLYFYVHYFFASNLAHVCALYASFLAIAIGIGTPPALAALCLAFFSNLFGGLTHYSSGPAAILYEAGYNDIKEWWKAGLIISFVNIVIWGLIGGFWWKALGLW